MPKYKCKLCYCLAPIMGITVGLSLGWIIHFTLPNIAAIATVDKEVIDIASRLFVFATGMVGVILGLSFQNKQIYCSEDQTKASHQEKTVAIFLSFISLVVSVICLYSGNITLYFFIISIFLTACISQMGWGKLFWLFPPQQENQ